MKSLKEFLESFSVGLTLIFVLLPIRLAFVHFVADDWLGSFGLVTAFSLLIIFLAKKDKLGWFGRAFIRQMYKVHRGKRRIFVYTQLVLGLLFFSGTIFAIELGDTIFIAEQELVLETLEINSIEDFMEKSSQEIRLRDIPTAFLVFFYLVIFRFDIFAIIISSLNEITDGWVLHFSTVFLVEEIELIGILIYSKLTIKKPV